MGSKSLTGPETSSCYPSLIPPRDRVDIVTKVKDLEILSYVLCHLPILLAKHFFCGPKSCAAISRGDLESGVTDWPTGLKSRDAQGLAHRPNQLRWCLEPVRQHVLVESWMPSLPG